MTTVIRKNVTLSFIVTRDNPTIRPKNITWLFTSSLTPNTTRVLTVDVDSRYSFSRDRLSLTIRNVTLTDDGEYQLVAVNLAGNDSDYITLSVNGMYNVFVYDILHNVI